MPHHASRFSWPPDPDSEWTYISLPPVELAAFIAQSLLRPMTPVDVATHFTSARAAESCAYAAYTMRYRFEIDQILRMDTIRSDCIRAASSPRRHRRTESEG